MSNQKIQYIDLSKLILWTENPRDTISSDSDNQEITNIALSDKNSKWSLSKLAEKMGSYFDYSESPTVVFIDGHPIVYDGNRRVILALLKHGLVSNSSGFNFPLPDFPKEIPCNVCTHEIAIKNVYRKHSDSGSWSILDRDIFVNKFMGEPKSTFLVFDESTNLISSNPDLNKRFVKEEILDDANLTKMGFKREGDSLLSKHDEKQSQSILNDLVTKINNKDIDTRKNRSDPYAVLDTTSKKIIDDNKSKSFERLKPSKVATSTKSTASKTRRTKSQEVRLFGEDLILKLGNVNNLYRDLSWIYEQCQKNQNNLSKNFIGIIRMGLRLIVDLAKDEVGKGNIDEYIDEYFESGKSLLTKDLKTYLSNHSVTKESLVKLLHTGAHGYTASLNKDQAIAMSIIIGAMLKNTHGKN